MGDAQPERPKAIFVNDDEGAMGAHLISLIKQEDAFDWTEMTSSEEMRSAIREKEAPRGIWVPASFTATVTATNGDATPEVTVFENQYNEESFMLRTMLQSNIDVLVSQYANTTTSFERMLEQLQQNQVRAKITDPKLYGDETSMLVSGLLLMFIMGLVSSFVFLVMEDRLQHTMMRMAVAPVRSWEIALGNVMGVLAGGLLQIITILVLARVVFDYDFGGVPFMLHVTLFILFMLASLGLATTVAGLVRNKNQLTLLNPLIIIPTCMIGGCFWPVEIMPDVMQQMSYLVPQRWVLDGLSRLAAGDGPSELAMNFGVLTLFAAVLIGFGSAILRPAQEGEGV
jgi:ABC-2 type transport system permease protein